MVNITKDEAMALRKKYGNDAKIAIVNKHKHGGRKKYYLPEEPFLLRYLDKVRNNSIVVTKNCR